MDETEIDFSVQEITGEDLGEARLGLELNLGGDDEISLLEFVSGFTGVVRLVRLGLGLGLVNEVKVDLVTFSSLEVKSEVTGR